VNPDEKVVPIVPVKPRKNTLVNLLGMQVPALFGVAIFIIIESVVEPKTGFENAERDKGSRDKAFFLEDLGKRSKSFIIAEYLSVIVDLEFVRRQRIE